MIYIGGDITTKVMTTKRRRTETEEQDYVRVRRLAGVQGLKGASSNDRHHHEVGGGTLRMRRTRRYSCQLAVKKYPLITVPNCEGSSQSYTPH